MKGLINCLALRILRKRSLYLLIFVCLLSCSYVNAQALVGTYQVRVSLDHDNWTYDVGQPAIFSISVTLNNAPISGLPLKYSCGPEMLSPTVEKTDITTSRPTVINAAGLREPGFFRCIATVEKDGRTYRGLATAGYQPEKIKPVVNEPTDFDQFWNDGRTRLAKIAIEPRMELLPASSTSKVDVYQVSFQTVGTGLSATSRIYGILAIPKTTSPNQKFPALLRVPGAGVRQYTGQIATAELGIITLEIGIHGIPVTLPQSFYDDLRNGALNRYMFYNMDDRETYYYRRVFLSVIRANDFLASLPQYDGRNLGVIGGSQGGALAIVTAALDPRVKVLAASYPAMSDMAGYTADRAGGWPHGFRDVKMRTKEKLDTAAYYDVVNFARRLRVPGLYSWGFNDEVCPPTSTYASYNVISAQKRLMLGLEMGHANTPEQTEKLNTWIEKYLKEGKAE